ncbi:hypothetical protein QQF64_005256 [Cirrhinus molitorella]|uniref:Uncharacterized protein n=1 Tax=Cirrhinus molitorella TaxID=172907 RepID=A0ABR3MK74_9TELE
MKRCRTNIVSEICCGSGAEVDAHRRLCVSQLISQHAPVSLQTHSSLHLKQNKAQMLLLLELLMLMLN